jgi:Ni/Co efflux regulator RcnB
MKKLILAAIAASAFAAPTAAMAHDPIEVTLPTGDTYYLDQDSYTVWHETNGKTGLQKTETIDVDANGNQKVTPPDTQVQA